MATTIQPSLGNGALFTQGGVGTAPGYDAIDLRRALGVALQEGAVEANAYKVSQRAASANMSVDIAATSGTCLVQGDFVSGQGLYPVPPHSATINETISAADASNPRIDQVVLELQDNTHDSSGASRARVRVINGTPTSGATLDNRTGAASLPSSCMRLADVLVGAGVTSITTSNIRGRRPWARGAYSRIVRNANAAASNDYTTTSTSAVAIDSTNLNPRIECSGVPMRATLRGRFANSVVGTIGFGVRLDGAVLDGGEQFSAYEHTATQFQGISIISWDFVPSAGSHQVAPYWLTATGTVTAYARSDRPLQWVVEELVRQNASND